MEEDVAKAVIKALRAYLNEELPLDKDFIRELDGRDLLARNKASMLVALADRGDKDCIHQLVTYMEQFYTEEMLLSLCVFLKEYAQPARPKLATIASRIRQEISKRHKPQAPIHEEPIRSSPEVHAVEEMLFPVITPLREEFSELVSEVFVEIGNLKKERMEKLHTYLTTLLPPSCKDRSRAKLPCVPKCVEELKEYLGTMWDELHVDVLHSIVKHLKNEKLKKMMTHYQLTLSKEGKKSLSEYPVKTVQPDVASDETLVSVKIDRNPDQQTLENVVSFCNFFSTLEIAHAMFRGYKHGSTVLFFSIPTECVWSLPSCLLPSNLSVLEEWKVLFLSVKGAFTVDIKERRVIDYLMQTHNKDLQTKLQRLENDFNMKQEELRVMESRLPKNVIFRQEYSESTRIWPYHGQNFVSRSATGALPAGEERVLQGDTWRDPSTLLYDSFQRHSGRSTDFSAEGSRTSKKQETFRSQSQSDFPSNVFFGEAQMQSEHTNLKEYQRLSKIIPATVGSSCSRRVEIPHGSTGREKGEERLVQRHSGRSTDFSAEGSRTSKKQETFRSQSQSDFPSNVFFGEAQMQSEHTNLKEYQRLSKIIPATVGSSCSRRVEIPHGSTGREKGKERLVQLQCMEIGQSPSELSTWREEPSLPKEISFPTGVFVNGAIFVCNRLGSYQSHLFVYNSVTKTWSKLRFYASCEMSGTTLATTTKQVHCLGGDWRKKGKVERYSKVVFTFDCDSLRWSDNTLPPLNIGRCRATSTSFEGIIVVAGSSSEGGQLLSSVEVLNSSQQSSTWWKIHDLPVKSCDMQCTVSDSKLFIGCGVGTENTIFSCKLSAVKASLKEKLSYIPEALFWERLPETPLKWSGLAAVKNCLFAVGGLDGRNVRSSAVCVHDDRHVHRAWTAVSSVRKARAFPAIVLSPMNMQKLFVLGGLGAPFSVESCMHVVDIV